WGSSRPAAGRPGGSRFLLGRVAGPPAESADPAALLLGGATPDPEPFGVLEGVLEALARDGAAGADGLRGGDGVLVAPLGEEQVGVNADAGAVVHPTGVGDGPIGVVSVHHLASHVAPQSMQWCQRKSRQAAFRPSHRQMWPGRLGSRPGRISPQVAMSPAAMSARAAFLAL